MVAVFVLTKNENALCSGGENYPQGSGTRPAFNSSPMTYSCCSAMLCSWRESASTLKTLG